MILLKIRYVPLSLSKVSQVLNCVVKYNLPPLLNVRVLGQLTDDQITAYLQGYNIQNAANGIEAIRVEIGCTASYKDI